MPLPISPGPAASGPHGPAASGGPLDRCAAERVTGALRGPNGCFYLRDGAVYCVEGTPAPGIEARLGAAGRLTGDRWRRALETAGPDHCGGQFLVAEGWLTQSELEICHLGALLDAAFFALPLASETSSFTPGSRHWLGLVRGISAAALQRATARRRALLDRLRPWAAVDALPVVPLTPARSGHSPTTGRQRRLLARADGRHTPYELAHALGQSAFVTLLDARRLAAAGLIQMPTAPTALPRRRPGACHPVTEGPPPTWQLPVPDILETADPDIALLVRLRTALEENL
ncbi:hypothetical protein [Streptomyces chattanoogensis]|uniref:hypothetical protein n=1 Tax=Streptomyces chattanoogensis TaxID=66876 RepID=UPI0036B6001C